MVFDSLILRARGLTKSYGSESVLKNFNIDIWEGSIFGILGTSGSGKTTALRMLAGFEIPDSGSIEMYDKIIFDEQTNVPPEKRNIGMVFQDYALFPHLNVEKNRPMNPHPFLSKSILQKTLPSFAKLARLKPRDCAFVWEIHRVIRQSLRYGLTITFCIAFLGGKPTHAQSTISSAPSSEINDRMPDDIQRRIALIVSQYNDMGWDLSEYLADDRFQYIEGITEKFTRSAERRIESFEDYKEILAYEIKKNKLAEFYSTYSAELLAAEKEFGIPKEIIMGILGVESEFGRYKGSYNPLNA